ncbi:MAG: acetyl-coenzyme A synthetase [Candidatus Hinthialibacteria bacterium]
MNETIDRLLFEDRIFPPDPAFTAQAHIKDDSIYQEASLDRLGFWAKWAGQLEWMEPWTEVLEWKAPFAKWFVDGKLNACVNCVDRHVRNGLHNKAAIIWEGEPGDRRTLTYWDMQREVCKFANVLKDLGVQKGDRVVFYMPMIPELAIGVLACARIGAPHSVVFGGFSATSLKDRINDQQAKVVVTADGGWRRGGIVPLKQTTDEALKDCPSITACVVFQRIGGSHSITMKEGCDLWWHDLMAKADAWCEPEKMDSEDLLFILYTSGTTGKPKGIMHTTGGYLLGAYMTSLLVFDLKPEDVFWCTADIGWVTGHSYFVYGPMSNGATQVMYEGAPDTPSRDRFWKLCEDHGVTVFYTAPTAIRAFMKWGPQHPESRNLSRLRLLGSVGEPINPEAWMWYHTHIGNGRCPIVDTWWQTETGSIMITPLPGVTTLKPGSATVPFPGIEAEILTEKGKVVTSGGGYLCIKSPWPFMLRGIYGDPERYEQTYWGKWKGMYFPGDGATRDDDGYFWILGRVDDVINVAGHRIGTMEVESALVDHPLVAEAAVVGIPHEIKGTAIAAFVIIKEAGAPGPDLEKTLKQHVVDQIGAIARPEKIIFSSDLPKTRSGKIMRRLLRDIAEGKTLGDTTSLADPAVVESLKVKYEGEEG